MYSGTTFDAAPAAATAGEKTAICGHSFSNIELTSKMNFIFKWNSYPMFFETICVINRMILTLTSCLVQTGRGSSSTTTRMYMQFCTHTHVHCSELVLPCRHLHNAPMQRRCAVRVSRRRSRTRRWTRARTASPTSTAQTACPGRSSGSSCSPVAWVRKIPFRMITTSYIVDL